MTILLVRHGETNGNASRVIQHPETPLNANGRRQAEKVAKELALTSTVEAIVTSDYKRAQETAERLSQITGAKLSYNRLLRERNFGDLRGISYDDLGDVNPFAEHYNPPNGENWIDFHHRVDAAWDEITEQKEKITGTLVVVTHGLLIRSLIERTLHVPEKLLPSELIIDNTSITSITARPPWKVSALAVADHLSQKTKAEGLV